MTVWEVVLLVTGFICLCASFFIARRNDTSEDENWADQSSSSVWTEKEEELIRNRVTSLLEEEQQNLVDETMEQLNRLCNDKIIAIDEFSRPLLEKIEANHQEVVFMYNMLNEKEKEVTKIISEPVAREEKPEEKEKAKPVSRQKVSKKEASKQELPRKEISKKDSPDRESPMQQESETVKRTSAGRTAEREGQKNPAPERPAAERQPAIPPKRGQRSLTPVSGKKPSMPDGRSKDVNALIQKMHKEGKSVLEISKALNIGQGEVKLVITLYGGRGR